MRRRLIVIGVVLLLLSGVAVLTWTLAGLPPVRYILRYGLAPGCEPTGQTMEIEGVEFVEIGPGIFRMGSTHGTEGGDWLGKLCEQFGLPWGERPEPSNAMPVHWVEFRGGFWIARTEVTNAQYERFAPEHERSEFSKGDEHPVVEVSWEEAKAWCAWLSMRSGLAVRLPSEAEWECACRAGSETEFSFGEYAAELPKHAWFDDMAEGRTHAVAGLRANAWGFHDLHGNVWEWCEDSYHESYDGAPGDGSAWTEGGEEWEPGSPVRVIRGGSYDAPAMGCRSAYRIWGHAANRYRDIGFRPAFQAKSSPDIE